MDTNSLAGSKAAARRDQIHARNVVRLYAKASGPRMEQEVTEVGGIQSVFREHYEAAVVPPLVCASSTWFFDRVTAAKVQNWMRSAECQKRNASAEPSPDGDGTRSRGPAKHTNRRRC
jgi:hypothetical protein